jgi:hypothetical protein
MGGYNSGRHGGKRTTDDMHPLDIRKINRAGCLKPWQSFGWQWSSNGKVVASINIRVLDDSVNLNYRTRDRGGEWQDMDYRVRIERTACHYGGQRVWWVCPAVGCGRRVAVLYGGKVYACRHCHKLNYQSTRETPDDQATRRADKIRKRLGWEAGILNGNGIKPKGMHWTTFDRMERQHDAHVNAALAGMAERLGIMNDRLSRIRV